MRRKAADAAHEAGQKKRLARQESLDELEELLQHTRGKQVVFAERLTIWSGILAKLTSADSARAEKPPDMSWQAHFEGLHGGSIELVPPVFDSTDLTFEDVIIHVSGTMGKIKKDLSKLEDTAKKLETKQERCHKSKQKREAKLEAKVEAAIMGKGEDKEKVAADKCLGGPFFLLYSLFRQCVTSKLNTVISYATSGKGAGSTITTRLQVWTGSARGRLLTMVNFSSHSRSPGRCPRFSRSWTCLTSTKR